VWPLVEWQGEIVWMQDVVLEPDPGLPFSIEVTQLASGAEAPG